MPTLAAQGRIKGFLSRETHTLLSKAVSFANRKYAYNDYAKDIHKQVPEVLDLVSLPLQKALHQICSFPDDANIETVEYHRRPRNGYSIPAHQDNFYHCITPPAGFKLLIPLQEISQSSGGLIFYAEAAWDQKLMKHEASRLANFSSQVAASEFDSSAKTLCYSLHPGDASYHYLNAIHWAEVNRSEEDKEFIVIRVQSGNARICQEQAKEYKRVYEQHLRLMELTDARLSGQQE